ncbi:MULTISPECIES: ImmA/IrrE family metallo-endopeptidase [Rhizobium]|uniref:ImmA/IrrE family metallo-endopeptidase n=1 Tax=Rhizobium TaxID=379 RepID=UPI00102F7A9F|nr:MULTISPECIES: ImmA/IrrE family metallo-endopeptidase [Rhizobium]MBY5483245.1 hypothetical protein [Rhizobium leguminosarum]NEI28465.1 hypothetical protein [Rhizobium ruizarguesonis]NKL64989.1 hypothetical protein [Rhizobium leguminosarum bv. viciae]TBA81183.1 hypothetical protein ELH56_13515 [Rhizobium ruizarguesonis]TBZ64519.1 hypothetical protein E0H43_32875 [Rhizobium leguminosarum bv. viciae]
MEAAALIPSKTKRTQVEREFRTELSALGLDWKSLKKVLPDWADTAFNSRAGFLELKTFLVRNTGLEMHENGVLTSRSLPTARFKTTAGTSQDQVVAARTIATACAKLVAKATNTSWGGLSSHADQLRRLATARSKRNWVDFESVLEACWSSGVPVIYLPDLPIKGRKMEGMVTYVGGHPVVVLTKKITNPDWMLFILAHEIGHIAKGHLQETEGEAIVDEKIEDEDTGDQQEQEANSYATALLAKDGMEFVIEGALPRAPELAAEALEFGSKHGVSPGYVILNAIHNSRIRGKQPFGLAHAALKLLPDYLTNADVASLCKAALRRHVNADHLSDDSVEYLEKLAQL